MPNAYTHAYTLPLDVQYFVSMSDVSLTNKIDILFLAFEWYDNYIIRFITALW